MTPSQLRTERLARGWSHKRLAAELGVGNPESYRTVICRLEQGRQVIGAGMAARLREVFARVPQNVN